MWLQTAKLPIKNSHWTGMTPRQITSTDTTTHPNNNANAYKDKTQSSQSHLEKFKDVHDAWKVKNENGLTTPWNLYAS